MAKSNSANNFEDMLSVRLKWALESTIVHFLGRPDRNAIEDWAEGLALDMAGERSAWQRISPLQTKIIDQGLSSSAVTSPNGKVTPTTS